MSTLKPNLKRLGSKKVLIVDDDVDLRESFDMVFRLEDYDVLSAKDGAEAMEMLGNLSEKELPDLILLDYQMPRMDGVTFSQIMAKSEKFSGIPVVLLSASGDKKDIRERARANAFVQKPIELGRLLEIAHHFLHRMETSKFSFLV